MLQALKGLRDDVVHNSRVATVGDLKFNFEVCSVAFFQYQKHRCIWIEQKEHTARLVINPSRNVESEFFMIDTNKSS